ncbi:venom allergen [Anopheles sinensis]|uniref:SCP domain-containing protein n=1 Tax=Anopheles sinensis TaxID=74873 RepID=A0A084W362_ANOSI|nr:venom allergen [Anopheles sinensis]
MTTAFKDKILQMHNAIRSKGALGLSGNSGLPKSSRSATVVWDDGLAVQASHMSRTCEIYSQVCSNTADLSNVGILTTQLGGPAAQNKDYNAAIDDAMDTWSMGYLAVGGDEIDSYPGYASDPAYMQLVRGNVYKIGCAIHYGKKGSGPALYTVCNYSSANVVGEPVYSKGPTASACKTGTNPNYPGLCSVNEIFK